MQTKDNGKCMQEQDVGKRSAIIYKIGLDK